MLHQILHNNAQTEILWEKEKNLNRNLMTFLTFNLSIRVRLWFRLVGRGNEFVPSLAMEFDLIRRVFFLVGPEQKRYQRRHVVYVFIVDHVFSLRKNFA